MIAAITIGMTPGSWVRGIIAYSGAVGALIWISHLAHLIRHRRLIVFLDQCPEPTRPPVVIPDDPAWPAVTLIFAARDEAAGVEAASRSMLDQTNGDPNLRIVAVDDRSTDATGPILDQLATTNPALGVVHIDQLPAGWLGKTHALQQGADFPTARAARWLLFTDADVVFQPGMVRRAVRYAEVHRIDHLIVAPGVVTRSTGERIFLSLFGLLFSLHGPIGRLSDRRSRVFMGVGAFNLVRAEAFRAVGGFRHLALSVDDDMRLGQTLKYAGYPVGLVMGERAIAVRWQERTWGMIRGIEKNFFAGLKFQLSRVVLVAVGIILLGIAPFAALAVGPIGTRLTALAGVIGLMILLESSGRQSRCRWYSALFLPIGAVLVLIALLWSVIQTYRHGGVIWRDNHYPLAALRTHVRERTVWLDEVWRSTR